LSDKQCQQLQEYVGRGGSLFATFETGFYDENGGRRSDSGLADLFGFRSNGGPLGPDEGNSAHAQIERDDPVLHGFTHRTVLPLAEYFMPLQPISDPILTMLPPFPGFPPELAYPVSARTDQPAIVLADRGKSRLVYLAGDIDRSYWQSQNPDLSRLLINAIRWMCPASPLAIPGDGFVEVIAWKTRLGFAIHLLNYTNPQTLRGTYFESYPLGPQTVKMNLPVGSKISQVSLLTAGTRLPISHVGSATTFTVPRLRDYGVAAIV
jgi:hypothetical protein